MGPHAQPPLFKPYRTLIVDDNRDAANCLALVLRLLGHAVDQAYDGPTGVAKVAEFRPHLVLCDLAMPRMDGLEVARQIRGICASEQVLLVALTGFSDDLRKQQAREAGFDAYLLKPVAVEEILAFLNPACLSGERALAGSSSSIH
jgi:CheY-like chemotaxis protein